eukprot:4742957-Heterocapsa_arctica.AAC.1
MLLQRSRVDRSLLTVTDDLLRQECARVVSLTADDLNGFSAKKLEKGVAELGELSHCTPEK